MPRDRVVFDPDRNKRERLIAQLEAAMQLVLEYDVGKGQAVVNFLASLQDLGAVEALLEEHFSSKDKIAILEMVEERMGEQKRGRN